MSSSAPPPPPGARPTPARVSTRALLGAPAPLTAVRPQGGADLSRGVFAVPSDGALAFELSGAAATIDCAHRVRPGETIATGTSTGVAVGDHSSRELTGSTPGATAAVAVALGDPRTLRSPRSVTEVGRYPRPRPRGLGHLQPTHILLV